MNRIAIDITRAITPPSLFGIDRRNAYANSKYHSGWMCTGVTSGLAGVKLSGSLRMYGSFRVNIVNIIICVCVCVCMYVCIYIHTYIPCIHNCVTKIVGFGTSHVYTNIHKFYSAKYYRHFTKQYYKSSLHIKTSATK